MAQLKHPKLRHPSRQGGMMVALTDVADQIPEMPVCPSGEWRPETVQLWEDLWSTDLSMKFIMPQTDLPILRRLMFLNDEILYAMENYREMRFYETAQGLRVNPAWKVITDCAKEIARIEAMFGFSPLHRMRLGIAIGEASEKLEMFSGAPRGETFRPQVLKMQREEAERATEEMVEVE